MKLPKLSQSGFAPIALILVLVVSIVAGTILVQQRTQTTSRADEWWREEEPAQEEEQQQEESDPEPEQQQEEAQPEEPQQPEEPEQPAAEEPATPPDQEQPANQEGTAPDQTEDQTADTSDASGQGGEEPGFFEKISDAAADIVEGVKDSVLDFSDGLGITNPEEERQGEIQDAENGDNEIKNRLLAALNDPENGDKNKEDLKAELGLDPGASDEELFSALKAQWNEQGIRVQGNSFADFTIYLPDADLVALANTGNASDIPIGQTGDIALSMGVGCAGNNFGIAQSQIICGPADFTPSSSGVSQSVTGPKTPTEDELDYCNKIGENEGPCKPIPNKLPACAEGVVSSQDACISKPKDLPPCVQGFQAECKYEVADREVCSGEGDQDNCIYVPKSQPANQSPLNECLTAKKYMEPDCLNGGTGLLTSSSSGGSGSDSSSTLQRQTPVVIRDDDYEDNIAEQYRLRSLLKQVSDKEDEIEDLRGEIDSVRNNLQKLSPSDQNIANAQIRRLEEQISSIQDQVDKTEADPKYQQDLKMAIAEYNVSKDPVVKGSNHQVTQLSAEANQRHIEAQDLVHRIYEYAYDNRPVTTLSDEKTKIDEVIDGLEKRTNSQELKDLIKEYRIAQARDEEALANFNKTLNANNQLREQKLGEFLKVKP